MLKGVNHQKPTPYILPKLLNKQKNEQARIRKALQFA